MRRFSSILSSSAPRMRTIAAAREAAAGGVRWIGSQSCLDKRRRRLPGSGCEGMVPGPSVARASSRGTAGSVVVGSHRTSSAVLLRIRARTAAPASGRPSRSPRWLIGDTTSPGARTCSAVLEGLVYGHESASMRSALFDVEPLMHRRRPYVGTSASRLGHGPSREMAPESHTRDRSATHSPYPSSRRLALISSSRRAASACCSRRVATRRRIFSSNGSSSSSASSAPT